LHISLKVFSCLAAFFFLGFFAFSSHPETCKQETTSSDRHEEILKNIYEEVLELGNRDGEDFIKREFFMDLDGDKVNKEEQVVVLSHDDGNRKKMIVQVTYFHPRKSNKFIKHAIANKTVTCFIIDESLQVKSSDYTETELETILPEILNGIRDKKKLLKLIRDKK
jgi:hypothetical protein